ncbi:uncharacterized protein DSM5745_03238 [Aspergillus mulundensis]|uniref:Mid2 domain-containing protein n=1 Tax=Aspergillus mulundensis TaxID=1810919 RepID=A0A3D8SJY4_9EURO|nr:hypothetical protein DSM5745_03238 [Aspergillus mulundensis]RDW86596.1 hypothetical protein DSM5745_03238 [Aspergillus mulundensis]
MTEKVSVETSTKAITESISTKTSTKVMTESVSTKRSTTTAVPTTSTTSRAKSATATKTPEATITTDAEAAITTDAAAATTHSTTAAASSATTSIAPSKVLSEVEAQPTSATVTSSHKGLSGGAIGGIVGGVVSLVLILCLVAFLLRRLRKKRGKKVRRFTLLRWRHPTLDDAQSAEEGTASTAHLQPQTTAVNPALTVPTIVTGPLNTQPTGITGEKSPAISPLQRQQADSPRSIPSASASAIIPSPLTPYSAISPKTTRNSMLKLNFRPPSGIHPALRPGDPEHAYNPLSYWPSFCTPNTSRRNSPTTSPLRHSPATHELFDTGFRLGRLELPSTCSRELINVPFRDRQRQRQKSQLHRGAPLPLSITTPDGAVLSSNFNGLAVDPNSGLMACDEEAEVTAGETEMAPVPVPEARLQMKPACKKRRQKKKLLPLLPPLPLPPSPSHPPLTASSLGSIPASPTPSYRSEFRRGSREVAEKVREKFRRKA